ncbi:hypothetical protein B0A48_11200 [Cryoendolithus antarcticus]|uniref:Uncharacterized protein n=1 Tax=Cryoendolithus antarcticus TaxID=1507870 RepID=A0A1V8SUQ8_9PEZI|nr:hypothetical protein B0A48_11200 [Cryoendolithus antarcticus]
MANGTPTLPGTNAAPMGSKSASTEPLQNWQTVDLEPQLPSHGPEHLRLRILPKAEAHPYESLSAADKAQIRACYRLFYWGFFAVFVSIVAIVLLEWIYVGIWQPERARVAAQGLMKAGSRLNHAFGGVVGKGPRVRGL